MSDFKKVMKRALMAPVVAIGSFSAVYLVGMTVIDEPAPVTVIQPDAPGSPEGLMKKHGCWSGEAPKDMEGVIPGHVIIRMDGEIAAKYRGAKYVGVALDHLFTKPNPRVAEIVGFCR